MHNNRPKIKLVNGLRVYLGTYNPTDIPGYALRFSRSDENNLVLTYRDEENVLRAISLGDKSSITDVDSLLKKLIEKGHKEQVKKIQDHKNEIKDKISFPGDLEYFAELLNNIYGENLDDFIMLLTPVARDLILDDIKKLIKDLKYGIEDYAFEIKNQNVIIELVVKGKMYTLTIDKNDLTNVRETMNQIEKKSIIGNIIKKINSNKHPRDDITKKGNFYSYGGLKIYDSSFNPPENDNNNYYLRYSASEPGKLVLMRGKVVKLLKFNFNDVASWQKSLLSHQIIDKLIEEIVNEQWPHIDESRKITQVNKLLGDLSMKDSDYKNLPHEILILDSLLENTFNPTLDRGLINGKNNLILTKSLLNEMVKLNLYNEIGNNKNRGIDDNEFNYLVKFTIRYDENHIYLNFSGEHSFTFKVERKALEEFINSGQIASKDTRFDVKDGKVSVTINNQSYSLPTRHEAQAYREQAKNEFERQQQIETYSKSASQINQSSTINNNYLTTPPLKPILVKDWTSSTTYQAFLSALDKLKESLDKYIDKSKSNVDQILLHSNIKANSKDNKYKSINALFTKINEIMRKAKDNGYSSEIELCNDLNSISPLIDNVMKKSQAKGFGILNKLGIFNVNTSDTALALEQCQELFHFEVDSQQKKI